MYIQHSCILSSKSILFQTELVSDISHLDWRNGWWGHCFIEIVMESRERETKDFIRYGGFQCSPDWFSYGSNCNIRNTCSVYLLHLSLHSRDAVRSISDATFSLVALFALFADLVCFFPSSFSFSTSLYYCLCILVRTNSLSSHTYLR